MENLPLRSAQNVPRSSNIERKHSRCPVHASQNRSRPLASFGNPSANHYRSIRKEPLFRLEKSPQSFPSNALCAVEDISRDGYVSTSSRILLMPGYTDSCGVISNELPCWNWVAQVVCFVNDDIACPICLEKPVVPRMDRCGHVYCWPCVIRYMAYEGDLLSKKCAVCSYIMKLNEMKRVCLKFFPSPTVGESLEMVLVERSQCSFDVNAVERNDQIYHFFQEIKDDTLRVLVDEERSTLLALKVASLGEGDTEIIPHIEYALECISNELASFKNDATTSCSTSKIKSIHGQEPDRQHSFYQASNGQLVFLDGLMWKCLLTEYKDDKNLPTSLYVTVSSIRSLKMDAFSRKRWRYLNHLPIGCCFSLVEVDIESMISAETALQFQSVLRRRRLEHNRRKLEDLHLTKLKEEAENRIPFLPAGFVLSGHAELSNTQKTFSDADFVPLSVGSPTTVAQSSPPGVSFAEVTKSGASSVVGPDRVAVFPRTPNLPTGRRSVQFDSSVESWPSLSESMSNTADPFSDSLATILRRKAPSKRSRKRRGNADDRSNEVS